MRSTLRFSILLGLLAICRVPAQTVIVSEPEFVDVFFGLAASALVPLESQTGSIRATASNYGFASSSTVRLEFTGARSPVRFRGGREFEFIVRATSTDADPAVAYRLHMLSVKKHKRFAGFSTGHASMLGATVKMGADDVVPLKFARYGISSYRITTPPLAPGEYAFGFGFGRSGMTDVFCFGVD